MHQSDFPAEANPIEIKFTADSETWEQENKWTGFSRVFSPSEWRVLACERSSLCCIILQSDTMTIQCAASARGWRWFIQNGTPDMLMHPNKIKPDALIDLEMHNWEMQGRVLFSAALTYSQLLLYEGRRWLKHEKALEYLHKSVFPISFTAQETQLCLIHLLSLE